MNQMNKKEEEQELVLVETGKEQVIEEQQVDAETPKIVIDQAFVENRPLSYSSLKHFRKSPKHYVQYITRGEKSTDAEFLGTVIETLVLNFENFDKIFMVATKPDLRSNSGKAAWAEICDDARKTGRKLCTPEDLKTAEFCKESLLSHPDASKLILHKTKTQTKLKWLDRATNLPVIGYVDFESNLWDEDWAVDLKSTRDADPDNFQRDLWSEKMQYYLQAGGYLVGFHKSKYRFPYFVDLAVETSAPYNVSVNFFEPKEIEFAKNEFLGTLKSFRYCMDNNLFHQGYEFRLSEGSVYFPVRKPGWLKSRYEELGK